MHRATFFFLLLLLLFAFPGYSVPQNKTVPVPLPGAAPQDDTGPAIPEHIQKEIEKKANTQRQADLKRDTEKLLKLSTELKEYVDKSNENVLSIEVVTKAEEIEKLAHSVKMKMRGD